MYTKSNVYKVFSSIVFATHILSALGIIVFVITSSSQRTLMGFIDTLLGIDGYTSIIAVVAVLTAIVSLFFSYMEFSSMFSFAKMIDYVQSDDNKPMRRLPFTLPYKFYGTFGSVIFFTTFVISFIISVILLISYSIQKNAFLALPVLPVLGIVLCNVYVFLHYFVRYQAISDMMRVNSGDDSALLKQSIKDIKSGYLRGYCIFYALVCVFTVIVGIVGGFMTFGRISDVFGNGIAVVYAIIQIISIVISIIYMSIFGCYVDNIAKMVESYQIKFGFWSGKKED